MDSRYANTTLVRAGNLTLDQAGQEKVRIQGIVLDKGNEVTGQENDGGTDVGRIAVAESADSVIMQWDTAV